LLLICSTCLCLGLISFHVSSVDICASRTDYLC
jgi:hypothetical protein